MRRALVLPLLLTLLLCASPVEAEEGELPGADIVYVFRHVEAMRLAEIVAEIADWRGLTVTVEPALAKKKVTLDLQYTDVGCLDVLARAAGGHLWKTGEEAYAIRTKPPPPEAVPPEEEIDPPESDEEPPPQPAWAQAIWKALDDTPYEGVYRRTPFPEILAAMAKQAGVPFFFDPAVTRGKTEKEQRIDFQDYLGGSSMHDAMLLILGTERLSWSTRWGALFITTYERELAMPDDVLVRGSDPVADALTAKLDGHRVTCRLKRASLAKGIQLITARSGVEVVLDKSLAAWARKRRFRITFADQSLRHALSLLLVPAGLGLRVDGERLVVVAR